MSIGPVEVVVDVAFWCAETAEKDFLGRDWQGAGGGNIAGAGGMGLRGDEPLCRAASLERLASLQ